VLLQDSTQTGLARIFTVRPIVAPQNWLADRKAPGFAKTRKSWSERLRLASIRVLKGPVPVKPGSRSVGANDMAAVGEQQRRE
jgi:hypothetical protein